MGKINVLDFSIANLIAAGEVVERPASVVKELLENSIDSGADMITVEIKNGGVSFIRVADNGYGMAAEDLPVAIKRHATSKIQKAEDLDAIFTLGFRGEALAAISSVADMRILSRQKDEPSGNMLVSEAGLAPSVSECGCSAGTTVIVENLFSTVPARRKFLKKDSTETMAVSAVVEKIALSHPKISIKFIADGNIKFATSGDGILLNAIYALMGRDFATKLIEVAAANDNLKVSGYIGRPDNVRANRNFQNVFINGRYIKSKTISAALEQAFTSYIQPERFPACILFIEVLPSLVDVNVHPAKLEVKFANEKAVFETVYYAVRSALENRVTRPELEMKIKGAQDMKENRTVSAFVPMRDTRVAPPEFSGNVQVTIENTGMFRRDNFDRLKGTPEKKTSEHPDIKSWMSVSTPSDLSVPTPSDEDAPVQISDQVETVPQVTAEISENVNLSQENVELPLPEKEEEKDTKIEETDFSTVDYRIAGVLFDCYVFVELDNKVIIIDKHAAHERIIFESLKENTKKTHRSTQLLFIPIEVSLSHTEYAALKEYSADFEKTGFGVEFSSDNKVNVFEVPVGIENSAVPDMVVTIASRLSDDMSVAQDREMAYEKALYQASCKAAVKGGRYDEPETIKWICDRVINDPRIRFCPHGRPVSLEMTKSEFDKQFSRI